jgi:hypothetical protein
MSLMMPWYESEWGIFAAPGLVPLILSILLIITGLILLLRAVYSKTFYKVLEEQIAKDAVIMQPDAEASGANKEQGEAIKAEPEWKRILLTIGFAAIYVFLLLGRLPYLISTGIFVSVFIFVFKGGGIVKSVLIGAVTSVGVWLVFEKVFLVVLP